MEELGAEHVSGLVQHRPVLDQVILLLVQGLVVLDLLLQVLGLLVDLLFQLLELGVSGLVAVGYNVAVVLQQLLGVAALGDALVELAHLLLDVGQAQGGLVAALYLIREGPVDQRQVGVRVHEVQAVDLSQVVEDLPGALAGHQEVVVPHGLRSKQAHC